MCFALLGLKTQTGSNILFVYMCLMINVSNLMNEAPEIDARASELHKFHGFFLSLIMEKENQSYLHTKCLTTFDTS